MVVNSFILLSYAPVSKEKKFTDQHTFRELLYKILFARLIGADTVSSNILSISPVDLAILSTHQKVSVGMASFP